jgi:hypothetical protein
MRSILTLAIGVVVSHVVCAETVSVETLRVSGVGSCLPYHVTYSPDTTETLIDFSVKPFEKVQVLMRNNEGFEKKVQATSYGGLLGFKGSYSTAAVQVGKCTFSLSHAPQINQTEQSQIQSSSTKADESRLMQIQQQMDKLIAAISQTNDLPKEDSHVKDVVIQSDPAYPIGVIEKPVVKVDTVPVTKIIEPTVVQNDEWQLVRPTTKVQPLKSLKFEKERNSVLIELERGRGYEVISAKNNKGIDQYKGKINNLHRVLLPYMSDDKITLVISDLKSNKFVYFFEPPESLKRLDVSPVAPLMVKQEQNIAPVVSVAAPNRMKEEHIAAFTEITHAPQEGFHLELRTGQYLSNELSRFIEQKFKWKLVWSRSTDVMVNQEKTVYINDINALALWLSDNTPLNVLTNVKTKQLIVTE